ncbi:nuclear transport factor 2 family protein [Mycobacterium xenopi]|uniref:nuclear transport factor 2 family protein n=1 Tax=Mycobacterium xenopi TaxID=1789 RepID=UPI0022EA4080|nr:nuclear transport factor 2 family protein [Mycobacterium xenopi]MDA3664118.1 nuclear transport factor 2 family protein [Mycobacterium xenopi]
MTDIQSAPLRPSSDSATPTFSAEMWAAYWAAPTLTRGFDFLADDIVGYWSDDAEPVPGKEAHTAEIAELLIAAPDLKLELVDSATVPSAAVGEQLVFLHYVGQGTGPDGPFTIRGLDRVRSRNGMVVENVIRYEPAVLASR